MPSSAQAVKRYSDRGGVAPGSNRKRGTLFSRLCELPSLYAAFERVRRKRGSKSAIEDFSIEKFSADANTNIRVLRDKLKRRTFSFSPLRPVAVEKKGRSGYRPILVPTVVDRIVQRAILHQISEPVAAYVSSRTSYAFREHDSGVRAAVHRLKAEIKAGYRVILVVDIVDFFSSIDADRVYDDLVTVLPDDSLVPLLRKLQRWEINDLASLPCHKRKCFPQAGKGVPQGSALSPILSNFYLRHLDQECERSGRRAIRYADDIAIACHSVAEAEQAYDWLSGHLTALGLTIHPLGASKKSRVVEIGPGSQPGIDYLGFFLMPIGRGVRIKPCQAAFMTARDEIADCFCPKSDAPLVERYLRLTHFLNSWVATYEQVCGRGKIDKERADLLEWAQRCLSRLLVTRGLLASDGLSTEQRRFLGVDSIFERAKLQQAVRKAVRTPRLVS